ncbi:hypothetical protein Y1Q_0015407 [Alligator mississippiensis]|uniref:Uncharacterized protein n=1 Tax=Alligator mississippiensis TaxID=8496 RepID=A0A151NCU1_ALLMI|nr:hypothetical protein Y1Q_0015407 [Alligator mississippiensis]
MGTENPEISCPSVGTGSPNVERYLGIGDWKARIPVARVQESPESGVGSCGGGKAQPLLSVRVFGIAQNKFFCGTGGYQLTKVYVLLQITDFGIGYA